MLKFLKFIDPLKKLNKYYHSKGTDPIGIKVLVYMIHVMTCLYYIIDNIVWLGNIGIVSKEVSRRTRWINYKDGCALLKNILSWLKTYFFYKRRQLSIAALWKELADSLNAGEVMNKDQLPLLKKILHKRKKQRYEVLSMIRY